MKLIQVLILFFLSIPSLANATCKEGVSKQISQDGNLGESDRPRLMDDCKKFQDYRLHLDKYADGAYLLYPGAFTCGKRQDYVEAYNMVIDKGGRYSPSLLDKFRTCRAIKTPTLVAVRTQKAPNDPVVAILYANEYSVYYLHSQWVNREELVSYKQHMRKKIK